MKRVLSAVLCILLLATMFVLGGCSKKEEPLKFGMGIVSAIEEATDADGDTNGAGEVTHDVAAVLVDAEGKIVKCRIDTAANSVAYTSEGKYVEAGDFATKREQGDNYGMVAYAKAEKEWYEQVDAFEALVVGKTADEVKAFIADGGKGTEDVINAGCTIVIAGFANAVVEAVEAAAESKATASATLNLGIYSAQADSKDATAEADGVNEVDTTVVAAALDAEGKVIVSSTDAIQAKFTFDAKGASTLADNTLSSKKDLGEKYGMAAYGADLNKDGVVKEWNEQAAAFDAACAGLNAEGIAALEVEGYGVESLQTAGCTIGISDMVQAAVKVATVAPPEK